MSHPETMHLLPDGYCLGSYEIQGYLGMGTHAEVYRATHRALGTVAALKIVRVPEGATWSQEVAGSMCRLRHPNIVSVQSVDYVGDRLIMAMDLVEGKLLRDILDGRGSLGLQEALRIAGCVASTLERAHGILVDGLSTLGHFDLSPSEVFLESDGTVRVKGFGLVQALGADPIQVCGAGSLAYLAPEQFDGRQTPRSDIWSLGVLLFEMLLARRPHPGSTPDACRESILTQELDIGPDFANLPPRIREIILRCLRTEPGERYASAADLCSELTAAAAIVDPSKCPKCGAELPPESDACFECVVDQLRKELSDGRHASRRRAQIAARTQRWYRRAVFVLPLAAAAALGSYLIWQEWKPAPLGGQAAKDVLKSSVASQTRTVAQPRVSGGIGSVSEQISSEPRTPLNSWGKREWEEILSLEKAPGGSYQDRIVRLVRFAAMYPGTAEADQATEKLRRWEDERRIFDATQEAERRPGSKICANLAKWKEFLAVQTTGLERAYAENRIDYWSKQVEGYTGNALLLVRSATGLPNTDLNLFGHGSPDAFFELVEGSKVVYRSRTISDNTSPRWDAGARIYLWPGLSMTLQIWDADVIGRKLMVSQALAPFPVDGPFQISLGGILIEAEIRRER